MGKIARFLDKQWDKKLGMYNSRTVRTYFGHPLSAHFAKFVPYRFRNFHRSFAKSNGFFWIPCPLCGSYFGGHESGDGIPDPFDGPEEYEEEKRTVEALLGDIEVGPATRGLLICSRCTIIKNITIPNKKDKT